jgi:hypothetical protein
METSSLSGRRQRGHESSNGGGNGTLAGSDSESESDIDVGPPRLYIYTVGGAQTHLSQISVICLL